MRANVLLTFAGGNCGTQPVQNQDPPLVFEDSRTLKDAARKILAEEAVQEKDPDKFMEIVNALNRAFEGEEARKKAR
jgi:hypothetical protein